MENKYNFYKYKKNETQTIECPVFVNDMDRLYYKETVVASLRSSAAQFKKRSGKEIKISFRKPWKKIIVRRVK